MLYLFIAFAGGRRGKKLLKLEQVQAVTRFIVNFAYQHCILLPGRIPGVKSADVKLLPTSITKAHIWRLYRRSQPEHGAVALSTFRKLWKDLLPYIVVAKPATDLCWTCQKNNSLIIKQVHVMLLALSFESLWNLILFFISVCLLLWSNG